MDKNKFHPAIREKQILEFEKERESLKVHQKKCRQWIKDELPSKTKLLIIDVSQGGFEAQAVDDPKLLEWVRELQFGNGAIHYGSVFRNVLGFKNDDQRCMVWDASQESEKSLPDLKEIDAFLITGGPAMPSEMNAGQENKNSAWLKQTVGVLQNLAAAEVPGLALCLGHQLWSVATGAKVGKLKPKREFGTVSIRAANSAKNIKLLDGFWDENNQVSITASHSESVIEPSTYKGMEHVAGNDYCDFQAAVYPLIQSRDLERANESDKIILSIQNHPEFMAAYLEILRRIRKNALKKEGFDVEKMIYSDTPRVRVIFYNFIQMLARRAQRRSR